MIWVLETWVSFWFGFEFVSWFVRNKCHILERIAIGIPVGLFTFAWGLFLTSMNRVVGLTNGVISCIVLSLAAGYLRFKNRKCRLLVKVSIPVSMFWGCLVTIIFLGLIVYISMLFHDKYSLGAGYGDLPFHMNIISSFATGCNYNRSSIFDIKTSFYAKEPLAYPVMTNYLSSVLISSGKATLRISLLIPSLSVMISLVLGISSLVYEFTRRPATVPMAFCLFLFLGGHGWTRLLSSSIFSQNGRPDFVSEWPGHQQEYWFHCIYHVLVPQRASLFSMPLCYWTLLLLIRGIREESKGAMFIAGILTGFMPQVQVHSYVAMAQWAIVFCVITFPWRRPKDWPKYIGLWCAFAITANVMALPQLAPFRKRLGNHEFLKFGRLWKHMSPARMWWYGLGVFGAVALVFGWIELDRSQIELYIPSVVVFLIANVVKYQPWEMDNLKVFYAGWIPLALGVVSQYMCRLFDTSWGGVLGMSLIGLSCLSGFLCTVIFTVSPAAIFRDKNDWELGKWVAENTKVDGIFLVNPIHSHPAAAIAGRQLFMGYGGWVTSHGLEYWIRKRNNEMFGDPVYFKKAANFGIDYLISNNQYFMAFEQDDVGEKHWIKIFTNEKYHVWKLVKE